MYNNASIWQLCTWFEVNFEENLFLIYVSFRGRGASNEYPQHISIVSLTSSLVIKMLTVPVSTIPNSQVFLLKKCE